MFHLKERVTQFSSGMGGRGWSESCHLWLTAQFLHLFQLYLGLVTWWNELQRESSCHFLTIFFWSERKRKSTNYPLIASRLAWLKHLITQGLWWNLRPLLSALSVVISTIMCLSAFWVTFRAVTILPGLTGSRGKQEPVPGGQGLETCACKHMGRWLFSHSTTAHTWDGETFHFMVSSRYWSPFG